MPLDIHVRNVLSQAGCWNVQLVDANNAQPALQNTSSGKEWKGARVLMDVATTMVPRDRCQNDARPALQKISSGQNQ